MVGVLLDRPALSSANRPIRSAGKYAFICGRLRYSFLLEVTVSESLFALFLFVAGVITVACCGVAALHGQTWQALAFGIGGMYVVVWSALRLLPAEARSR
jgi:hypothetical protein